MGEQIIQVLASGRKIFGAIITSISEAFAAIDTTGNGSLVRHL